jgi:hypothetical protein
VSYATYHHFTLGAVNPGRPNLWWGRDRALPFLDCWIVLRSLKDKIARGVDDFGEELIVLQQYRQEALERLAQDLEHLARVARRAADLLPVDELRTGGDRL